MPRLNAFTRSHVPGLVTGVALLLAMAGCGDRSRQDAPPPPPPAVIVAPVARADVTPSIGFVGRVEAVDKVDIRARVSGFLEKRFFEEGGDVAVGDPLFRIQPDEYRATVEQKRADLASAEATQVNTDVQLRRAETLARTKDIPEATVDERRAQNLSAKAAIQEARAALQKAELDLGYTEITSPIAGKIGRSAYTEGNLVGPDSGILATVVSNDPMYVTFPVSSRLLTEYRKKILERGSPEGILARVRLPDATLYEHPGRIDFTDVQVSATTDTVTVRAVFPNPQGLLVDGQFVTVILETEAPKSSLVIAQSALLVDQLGPYVLVVDADNKAQVRRVKTSQGKEGLVVVEEGLTEGERIIVEGILKARPGLPVTPTLAEAPGQTAS